MFIKIIGNKVEIAPQDLNDGERLIFGYGNDIELLTAEGWRQATELEVELIDGGFALVDAGEIVDIRLTPGFITSQKAAQKAAIVADYKDLFKDLDITYSGKVARGLATSQAYTAARATLQLELVTKLSEV